MKERILIFIFSTVVLLLFTFIWQRIFFNKDHLEKWRTQIIEAHSTTGINFKLSSFLIHPNVLKAVVTIMLLGGIFGFLLALRSLIFD